MGRLAQRYYHTRPSAAASGADRAPPQHGAGPGEDQWRGRRTSTGTGTGTVALARAPASANALRILRAFPPHCMIR
eukprot:scaffold48435_cov68-Phaeocystis_antarctica.AAC.2